MNDKSLLRKIFVLALIAIGGGLTAYSFAAPQQGLQIQQRRSAIAYAQLTLQADNQVIWDEGGNGIPRVDTIDGTYRRLGGSQRISLVNLLNAIGSNGWELVEVNNNVWTFKR